MEIVMSTYFGQGSGVIDDLIGKEHETHVMASTDCMLLVGEILS